MEVVAQQTIKATADGQLLPVKLSYVPQTPGEYKLTLEAVEQPGELVTTNNRLSTFVHVLKGGLNVLYLEGALRVEQKFIRRALDSSPDIKVDYVRIDPRDPKSRPADLADRFKPGKYDVYILGDVDSTAFHGDELAELAKCVSRGAGLIMLGGFQSFGPGGYGETPLANVLPVGMDRLERQQPDEPLRTDLHWPGPLQMQPTPLGLMHFALMLAGNRQENAALWAKLPPLEGANKFHDLAAGRRRAGRRRPGQAAAGRPQLRRRPRDGLRRRFDLALVDARLRVGPQAILAADRPVAGAQGPGAGGQRLGPAGAAPLRAVAAGRVHRGRQRRPPASRSPTPTFKAEIVLPDGARRPLSLVRQDEQMAGSFRDTQTAGDYAIEVTATQKDQPLGTARARFLVFQQDLELDNASADAPTMESLAAMTGGQSLAPEQLPELIQAPDRRDPTPRRAAGDEEDVLGHVAVLPDARRPAGRGVVFAEALGAGVGIGDLGFCPAACSFAVFRHEPTIIQYPVGTEGDRSMFSACVFSRRRRQAAEKWTSPRSHPFSGGSDCAGCGSCAAAIRPNHQENFDLPLRMGAKPGT